ncbi:hypothetical protein FHS43_001460 [Streptosporangium becharense]|uniref:MFS transporter n=1 Tax=Streptosporangium becharense TaxID=1816182 RepID=A0A7W9MJD9_9ACTN|nr:MFS transporter [Streptosporangium becharense]MBB2910197.1 hypothetical protein [Streptosporangium becharense]MBB5822940.1 hypothetical protein [Streptosporangium becharense]
MFVTSSFRLARASAFAAVCSGLGVVAHVFAGGTVTAASAAGGLALAFGIALPVTGRERGVRTILSLLGGGQAALHMLFAVTCPVVGHAGAAHPHSGLLADVAMLTMHGWAVVLTALWLARGEALLWSLLRRLGARLGPVLLGEPCPAGAPLLPPSQGGPGLPRLSALRHVLHRRGPPPRRPVFLSLVPGL